MDPAILSIDHTSSYPHHPGYSPVHQHAIAQYQHATTTLPPLAMGIHPPPASTTFPASAAGPVRRASAPRRRSKPYDPPATSSTSAQGNAPTIPSPTSPSAADDHLTSSSGITPPASQSTPLGGLPSGETKPLSDLENEIAQKRRRNTEAARRSRERKALRMQQLESQVAHLEAVNSQLSLKLAVVEKERAIFSAREQDLRRRVTNLETSLREAHEALMARAAASQAVQQDAEGDVRRAEAPGSQEQLHTISNVGELSNTAEVSS
ncbi:hypothetical protein BC832DRAFT_374575 [Gaertneriomyces semiglobifer]|nr:hypothetical protein BC832DRAFT_374575 [Gaertneriomyces semiglobifer]